MCLSASTTSGPEHTAPSYLVLSGQEEAYPNLRDPSNLRKVADALHSALALGGSSYPAANIRVWLADEQTIAATPTRHLLATGTKVGCSQRPCLEAGHSVET